MVDQVALSTLQVPRDIRESKNSTKTTKQNFKLVYRYLARPTRRPPLVVLHGAPSLPSNYLYPLADLGGFRSMLFYDQLGCGKSQGLSQSSTDKTSLSSFYTVQAAANDLELLLEQVIGSSSVTGYHLYGHFYGGCLAYEFLQRQSTIARRCRSVVLDATPTVAAQVATNYDTLLKAKGAAQLAAQHVCRRQPVPPMLAMAYQYPGRKWAGLQHMATYEAESSAVAGIEPLATPCLAVRGAHDFVPTMAPWKAHFRNLRLQDEIPRASHHVLYENPDVYGDLLRNFWLQHDV